MTQCTFRRRRGNSLQGSDPAAGCEGKPGGSQASRSSQGYWAHLSQVRCHQVSMRPVWLGRRAVSLPSGLGFLLPRRLSAWCGGMWVMSTWVASSKGTPALRCWELGIHASSLKQQNRRWEEISSFHVSRISSFPVSCCTAMCSG